jgi:hypothetical protein
VTASTVLAPAPSPAAGSTARRRFGWLSWLAWLNLALAGIYVVILARLMTTGLTVGADFTPFHTGWEIVLRGQGAQLYDPAVQAQVEREVLGGQSFAAGLNPFINPPYSVLPFVPLGLLSLDTGYVAWLAIQAGLLAVLLRTVLRGARDWSREERLAAVGWIVGFPALAIAFFQGAFSLVIAVGMLFAFEALRSDRQVRTGLWLVVASVKPQVVLGPALAVLVARRWRAVVAGAVAMAILCIAATIAFGIGTWSSYVQFLGLYTSTFDQLSVDPRVMWNLRGTLALLLGSGSASLINLLAYVGFAASLLATWIVWRGADRARDPGSLALRFAITLVLMLLFSPHVNPHDDILAVLAVVLGYGALRGQRLGTVLALGASLAPFVILATNGLGSDGATGLPIRVPTVLLAGLLALLTAGLTGSTRIRTELPVTAPANP